MVDKIQAPASSGVLPPAPLPQKPRFSSFPVDVLYSMGTTVGYQVFTVFAYCVVSTITFLAKLIEKQPSISDKDLTKPNELQEAFKQQPFLVIDKILDLSVSDPGQAKTILVNLATFYRNKNVYNNKDINNRREWVTFFETLITQLIKSTELQEFENRYTEMDSDDESLKSEFWAMYASDETWKKAQENPEMSKDELRRLSNVRRLNQENKAITDKWTSEFWEYCSNALQKIPDSGLKLHNFSLIPHQDKMFRFGVFCERLLYTGKLKDLQSDRAYNEWAKGLNAFFIELLGEKFVFQFPQVKLLIEKFNHILADPTQRKQFREIVHGVLKVYFPRD